MLQVVIIFSLKIPLYQRLGYLKKKREKKKKWKKRERKKKVWWKKYYSKAPVFQFFKVRSWEKLPFVKEHCRIRLSPLLPSTNILYHFVCNHTCTSWFDCMTSPSWSMVGLGNICIASMSELFLSHLWTPHNFTSYRVRERRHNVTLPYVKKYQIRGRQKAKHNCCLGKDPQIPQMRDWEGHTKESLSFIWKSYKNSGMKVDRRTRDIVLDMTILSFNCSRPKWRI